MFSWNYLLSVPDPGIQEIVMRIIRYLEPKEIQSLRKVGPQFERFISTKREAIQACFLSNTDVYQKVELHFTIKDEEMPIFEREWKEIYHGGENNDRNIMMEARRMQTLNTEVKCSIEMVGKRQEMIQGVKEINKGLSVKRTMKLIVKNTFYTWLEIGTSKPGKTR